MRPLRLISPPLGTSKYSHGAYMRTCSEFSKKKPLFLFLYPFNFYDRYDNSNILEHIDVSTTFNFLSNSFDYRSNMGVSDGQDLGANLSLHAGLAGD